MTGAMLKAELHKIYGRRGMFLVVVLGPVVLCVVILVVISVLHVVRDDVPSIGGLQTLQLFGIPVILGSLAYITLGAQEGSWDASNGTFRYLLLSGRSRGALYMTRVTALIILSLTTALAIIAIGCVFARLAPTIPRDEVGTSRYLEFAGTAILMLTFWSLLSHGIGSMMASNGAAITFSILAFFGTAIAGAILGLISHQIEYVFPGEAIAGIVGRGDAPLPTSIVVLTTWFAGAIGVGYARTEGSEY